MDKQTSQAKKLIKVMQILKEETDEDNPLTTNEILEKLKDDGIDCERKALYKYIKEINDLEVEVKTKRGTQNKYYVESRSFDNAELRVLIDAVQTFSFISKQQTTAIINKLAGLAGANRAELLSKKTMSFNKVKNGNVNIFENIAEIDKAIVENKGISFLYFDLDSGNNKKYRHNKQIYTARPLGLVFSGGNYYMAAENKKYATPSVYRVDNMDEITCQGAELCHIDAENAREYVAKISIFDMYGGNIEKVTLCVHNDMERIIRDKFGINVKKTDCDDDHFRISVDVPNTPVFLGWCAMFGNKVKVESPESVVNALKKHIEDSLEQYK